MVKGSNCSRLPPIPAGGGYGSEKRPDAHLKVRLPVKAGTRTLVATFLKDTVVPEGIVLRNRETAFFEGIGSISVGGPYNVQGPGATSSRDKIFLCHPAMPAEEQACAEKIIANLAHRAYRRPATADDLQQLLALYRARRAEQRVRGGHAAGAAEDSGVA